VAEELRRSTWPAGSGSAEGAAHLVDFADPLIPGERGPAQHHATVVHFHPGVLVELAVSSVGLSTEPKMISKQQQIQAGGGFRMDHR
jgi:hypothetical protein